MRTNKQIRRGEFPEDKEKINHFRCNRCGYVNRTGYKCPACGEENCEAI